MIIRSALGLAGGQLFVLPAEVTDEHVCEPDEFQMFE
jgi:hypothetical protein